MQAQRAQEVSDRDLAAFHAADLNTAEPRAGHYAAALVVPVRRSRLSASVFA